LTPQRQLTIPFTLLLAIAYVVPDWSGTIRGSPTKHTASESSTTFGAAAIGRSDSRGEPVHEKPPLFYISAAYVATLFSSWLPLHDGARLTSGIYAAATLVLVGLSARVTWGEGRGLVAVIAFLGCIGLLFDSHLMFTDNRPARWIRAVVLWARAQPDPSRFGGSCVGYRRGIGFMSRD